MQPHYQMCASFFASFESKNSSYDVLKINQQNHINS